MSTPYTTAEIWTKIRTLDTEIAALRTQPLNYRLYGKLVNRDKQLELLMMERRQWVASLAAASDSNVKEIATITDYEMDPFGNQVGDELKGSD